MRPRNKQAEAEQVPFNHSERLLLVMSVANREAGAGYKPGSSLRVSEMWLRSIRSKEVSELEQWVGLSAPEPPLRSPEPASDAFAYLPSRLGPSERLDLVCLFPACSAKKVASLCVSLLRVWVCVCVCYSLI
ncbi:E3 ubiquitin-protein ligase TRIM71 [Platysternon megacephalum]|uniref:E3 ubiquitin-protein ligase TRIM71 n=1 Tax=Platysternon megacephalum TaxID=55544 RepID=A0A4D9EY54_9SAUR|nr:E3 ubiquitin-protein ligase TRIM71 [Platysternon megacephalum]